MWIRRVLGGVVLMAVVSGCAGAADAGTSPSDSRVRAASGASGSPAPGRWVEPPRYSFVLKAGCTRGFYEAPFAVTVANGRVVRADALDQQARDVVKRYAYRAPTLGELLARAKKASADGDEVTTTLDPADGHPTAVTFNPSGAAVDAASCAVISDYAIG
jgi:hypothetical protein